MPLFEVMLDGSNSQGGHPQTNEVERSCTLTVEAADANTAKAFAEEHNPGLTATEAKPVS